MPGDVSTPFEENTSCKAGHCPVPSMVQCTVSSVQSMWHHATWIMMMHGNGEKFHTLKMSILFTLEMNYFIICSSGIPAACPEVT